MPSARDPETLFVLSQKVIVDFLTLPWRSRNQFTFEISNRINSILSCIPASLIDSVVSGVIEEFSRLKTVTEGGAAELLLKAVAVPQLQVLDCRTLVKLGYVSDEVRHGFQYTIAGLIPSLRNLVQLSFSTHKNEFTLPVCDDEVLWNIGCNCPHLKSLNFRCCNHVTDEGLKCLIPGFSDSTGCKHLEELYVFESSVTEKGVTLALEHLKKLRIVDFRELCTSLILLYNKCMTNGSRLLEDGLKITHINNLGVCRPAQKLQFDQKIVRICQILCPNLRNLKVRVTDFDVAHLKKLPSLTAVEFVYNIGRPLSPGEGTVNFLTQYGHQLSALTIICNLFAVELFVTIGDNCPNLKELWIKCNELLCNPEWVAPVSQRIVYTHLESLYVRIGETEDSECFLPSEVLVYILRCSWGLKSLQLIFRSVSVADTWFDSVLMEINTGSLEKIFIAIPGSNCNYSAVMLSMETVESIMIHCPKLKVLGNLLVWNVTRTQVKELRDWITARNLDVLIVYRFMKIK
ncbi:uncharacterized protein LOC126262271 [Schistocerca nitens]|uniref:uncharacterized protein LOC126262271 n=1 Tax=Schistocerca nitens TaxID=7011 RepID=UPI002117BE49|nr:uncharacterized protein LOC126262271 [Schistocerca nitens]